MAENRARHCRSSVLRIGIEDGPGTAEPIENCHKARLLDAVFKRLHKAAKGLAEVDRAGAAEFVIFPEGVDASRIETSRFLMTFANELRDLLHDPFRLGHRVDQITAHIGLAVGTDATTATRLYEQAGIALARSGAENGENVTLFLPGMQPRFDAISILDAELRTALAQDQLVLFAQPQVDITDDTVIGHELLVRWNHPERGLLLPAEFVCRAEQTGMIRKIDTWMIKQACRILASWAASGKTIARRLSVNVSRAHLCDPDFANKVAAIIKRYQAPASCLTLEITETMMMDDLSAALRNMTRLRRMGVSLSLDDFGTGFSSMNMIRQLPFTEVKIDQAFVADLPGNLRASQIVSTIIDLGQVLGLDVIAEGVETAAQENWLRQNGCRMVQGHRFGRATAQDW